jgi:hypothetical protein
MTNTSEKGFTLIEMILVTGLVIGATMLSLFEKASDLEQDRAKGLGVQMFQYNNAVRGWVSNNPLATDGLRQGSGWLKPASCGGGSAVEYLPCTFPDATTANPIMFGKLTLTTELKRITSGGVTHLLATTTSTGMQVGGKTRADLAGLAIITAAAGSVSGTTPVLMATESSFKSDPISAVMTMTAGSTPNNDAWLRTDGSNTMNSNLTFNASSAPGVRQVNNVSRLSGMGAEPLYLGLSGGALAGNVIVVDGDQSVLGNQIISNNRNLATAIMAVRGDIVANSGNVRASGGVHAGTDISANGTISAGANINANGSMNAAGNLTVGGGATVNSDIRSNANISSAGGIYATGNISTQGTMTASGQVNASGNINSAQSISAAGNVNAGNALVGQIFYDSNNMGYYVDPNNTSVLNTVAAMGAVSANGRITANEYVQLNAAAGAGGGCAPNGLLARAVDGSLLSCTNGVWAGASGFNGQYLFVQQAQGNYGGVNNTSGPMFINANGGSGQFPGNGCELKSCGNTCALAGTTAGVQAAYDVDNAITAAKSCSIGFWVPKGQAYNVQSLPYGNPYQGSFWIIAFGTP